MWSEEENKVKADDGCAEKSWCSSGSWSEAETNAYANCLPLIWLINNNIYFELDSVGGAFSQVMVPSHVLTGC